MVDAQTTTLSIDQVTAYYKLVETLLYVGISKGGKSFIISLLPYRKEPWLFFFLYSGQKQFHFLILSVGL